MAWDYDVGVVALSAPPSSAPKTTYRPAVSVRNNGIHDALASGVLRIYSAGRLVFTTELYSPVIPPGETKDALATTYWTPEAEGDYLVTADVSSPLDSDESNNHLGPTPVKVTGEAPPPPAPVTPHAAQHEDGGSDEVIIDGLHGRTADPQTPLAHKTSHQLGGSDQLNVDGLPGILAQGQPFAKHHEDHEDHGSDEINVDGLHGVLYNLQKPQGHGNEAHAPNFATSDEFGAHINGVDPHHYATGLEHPRYKGDPNGYAPLDSSALLPLANLPAHHESHESAGEDQVRGFQVHTNLITVAINDSPATIIEATLPSTALAANSHVKIISALLQESALSGDTIAFTLLVNNTPYLSLSWTNSAGLAIIGALQVDLVGRNDSPHWRSQIELRAAAGLDAAPVLKYNDPSEPNIPMAALIKLTAQLTGPSGEFRHLDSRFAALYLPSGLPS